MTLFFQPHLIPSVSAQVISMNQLRLKYNNYIICKITDHE